MVRPGLLSLPPEPCPERPSHRSEQAPHGAELRPDPRVQTSLSAATVTTEICGNVTHALKHFTNVCIYLPPKVCLEVRLGHLASVLFELDI